jgi:hypothetical protein
MYVVLRRHRSAPDRVIAIMLLPYICEQCIPPGILYRQPWSQTLRAMQQRREPQCGVWPPQPSWCLIVIHSGIRAKSQTMGGKGSSSASFKGMLFDGNMFKEERSATGLLEKAWRNSAEGDLARWKTWWMKSSSNGRVEVENGTRSVEHRLSHRLFLPTESRY